MKRMLLASASISMLLLGTAGTSVASDSWTIEESPPQKAWSSWDTVASGDGTTWAFGKTLPDGGDFHSKVFQRGPQGWTEVQVPDIGRLNGSTVVSGEDAWAVGDGVSIHWDGKRWSKVPMAAPGNMFPQFQGMQAFGSDDVWAVGVMSPDNNSMWRGAMQHWDGTKWSDVPLPGMPKDWELSGVNGVAPDDVWAVGSTDEKNVEGVALHWDGKQWSKVAVPKLGGNKGMVLKDVVALAADDVWSIGYSFGDKGGRQPIAIHWDGSEWTIAKTPKDLASLGDMTRVGEELWAIGYGPEFPYMLRYDGNAWRKAQAPDTKGTTVAGTALDDGRLMVVGTRGSAEQTAGFAAVRN